MTTADSTDRHTDVQRPGPVDAQGARDLVRRGQLRVLVVSPSFPYPPTWGFAKRVFHLVDQLALRHRVTFLSYVAPDDSPSARAAFAERIHELVAVPRPIRSVRAKRLRQGLSLLSRTPFHAAQLRDEDLQRAVDGVLERDRFDVIQIESSQLGWLRLPPSTPVVVDEHNIESELLGRMGQTETSLARRTYNRWEHRRYREYEKRVWSSAAACATTSKRDADAVAAQRPGLPVMVVPNGVDVEEFTSTGAPAEPGSIVFTGLLDYRPNEDGIRWFLKEVFPAVRAERPDAHITVVGRGPAELLESLRGPGVTVTGWVPEVRPFMDAAAVVVVPLRMGGGTRLKVVEAMSMSRGIVSTSLGAEGLDVVSGTHLELADDPQAFAGAVVGLLDDPDRAARLGATARRLAEERYSWARAATSLEDLLHEVARAGPAGQTAASTSDVPVRNTAQ